MKQRSFQIILLLLLAGISLNIFAQERRILPADEGKKDASFSVFRDKLIEAVKKHDVNFLLSVLDRNVKGSFGGDSGIEDFKRLWKLDSPKSKLWNELLIVLTNGGTFSKEAAVKNEQFCAPYSFTLFPEDLDAFEYQIIFGNKVNLRDKPDLKSKTVVQLSYNVVKVDYENSIKNKNDEDEYLWLKIETLGGKKGFINAKYVRSPIDYRACFEKRNGAWKMTLFLAGD